jgi:hypothetical protein
MGAPPANNALQLTSARCRPGQGAAGAGFRAAVLEALHNNEMQLTRSAWLTPGRPLQLISVLCEPKGGAMRLVATMMALGLLPGHDLRATSARIVHPELAHIAYATRYAPKRSRRARSHNNEMQRTRSAQATEPRR